MPTCKKTQIEKTVVIKEDGFELNIDAEDAAVLLDIIARIGGDATEGKPRGRLDKIGAALKDAGAERKRFPMDPDQPHYMYYAMKD